MKSPCKTYFYDEGNTKGEKELTMLKERVEITGSFFENNSYFV